MGQWIGCLRDRHREQAHSYRIGCSQLGFGGLENSFREQARSHSKQEQDQEIAAFGGSYIGIAVGLG
ncbi:hypothetical protein CXF97_00020 [Pseudomonas sp. Choline-02u-1]|nr:hypothetical protein CXF97_00020 [Pseudomonas sp. Choline-02u-1]